MSVTEKFRELLTAKVRQIDRQMAADSDRAAAYLKGRAAQHEEKINRVGREWKERLPTKIEQPRAVPKATSSIQNLDLFGACMLALLAALALGAAYAALHFGWFSSPWQLAIWLVVLVAFAIFGLPTSSGQQAGIAHGKFATRTDIDAFDIETDTTKPDTEDQGIYLGAFQDEERKWAPAELRYKGAKHLLCFGPTGSGKSNSLMIPNLQNLWRSVIVTDPKGEAAAITYEHRHNMGNAIVLNPFGVLVEDRAHLKSAGWNPLLQLDPESDDFESEASCIAEALTDKSGDSKSEFFETSMQNLWTAFCMWERSTKGDKASLRNVRETIASPRDKLLIVLEAMRSSKNYTMRIAANRAYDRLTDKNSQSTSLQDVIDTGLKSTAFLNDRRIADDMARGGAIDFAALHRTITTIYLILPPRQLEEQAKWLRMFVSLALRNLYKSAPTERAPPTLPRVLLMLDEFGNLGRLQEIVKAQNLVRSYRIQLWLFLQNIEQITETYKGAASSFLSNAGAVTTFKTGGMDIATAKHLSDAFGEKEMMVHTQNNSGGSTGPQAIPLIRPSDISRRSPNTTLNIIEPCPWPVPADTPVYIKTRFKEGLERNPTFFG